eukprot:758134-Hanusia_phi.AAC.2
MPREGKGGKNRSRAKSDRDGKRELHFKNTDEGQGRDIAENMHKYSRCTAGLGWRHTALTVSSACATSAGRWGPPWLPGAQVSTSHGTYVEVQDNKADVIDKYMPDEVRALKAANELPETVKLNETEEGGEDNFEFGSGGEEEDERQSESEESDKDDDIDDI